MAEWLKVLPASYTRPKEVRETACKELFAKLNYDAADSGTEISRLDAQGVLNLLGPNFCHALDFATRREYNDKVRLTEEDYQYRRIAAGGEIAWAINHAVEAQTLSEIRQADSVVLSLVEVPEQEQELQPLMLDKDVAA
ncbi:hypothetical protein H0V99_01020 [Candidatus Saccharibacteria bacterium]|nr:hypothetical protein [Candidatus Saccharibacteria bacterium]